MILVFDPKCVLIFLAASVSASTIVMDQSPKQVKPTITKTLRIDCMLVDSVATTAGTGLVGRSISSSTSILHLVRMAIFRGSTQLASITMFSPPTVEVAGSDVTVAGNISASATGEAGYLSVTIQDPGQEATGNYSCSASGLGADGHMAVLDTSTMVMAAAPDLADVVNFMHQLDLKDRQYSKQLADLASSRDYSNITALESKITNLQNQLNAKNTSMQELESRLQTQLNEKDTNITALESKTINLQTQLDAKDTRLQLLERKVTNLETQLNTKTQDSAVCSASCIVGIQKQIQYIGHNISTAGEQCVTPTNSTKHRGTIHLEGGDGQTSGTVIVTYNNLTGPVCDDDWDMDDAHVVCRMMGWSGATEYKTGNFYHYSMPAGHDYVLDNVQCTGTEHDLVDCYRYGLAVGQHDCSSDGSEAAGVVCSSTATGSVRIEGGNGYNYGTVIASYSGLTGPVCDNHWDMEDAHVVCRMMGFGGAREYKLGNSYNYNSSGDDYLLDDVDCTGTETNLLDCPSSGTGAPGVGYRSCGSDKVAGVVCNPIYGNIHLEGGNGQTSGTVIVTYNNLTGPVCDGYWDMDNAHVACRMLGWSGATEVKRDNFYHYSMPAGHDYVLDAVDCTGAQHDLIDCYRLGYAVGQHDSGCASDGSDAAGVVCSSTRL